MFPTLQDLFGWGPPIDTHSAFVALGMIAAGVVFLIEKRRRGVTDPRIPYLVLGALAGAATGLNLGTSNPDVQAKNGEAKATAKANGPRKRCSQPVTEDWDAASSVMKPP